MVNKLIANILPYMPQKLVWIFSSRYIAGETIEAGLAASRQLNDQKIRVTVDLLGEFIQDPDEAGANRDFYLDIIRRFSGEGIEGTFSLKPTMFGLLIDKERCTEYIREVVEFAAGHNRFVRIDMEDSQCVDAEIELFRSLHRDFPGNVGLVLQAYLRRTLGDLEALSELNTEENPLNIRLCKGIYIEPERIAYKKYMEVREHFMEDLEYMFRKRIFAAIATHDKYLVDHACRLIDEYQVPPDRYEFQMLYGVTPDLRRSVVEKGHQMRVYVPFGKQWFNYCTRRLKENPKMAQQIIKALFVRG